MKSIALNMLVWNEEDLLSHALNSVMPYVQEAHIIDTGSTDRTMRILEIAQGVWPQLSYEYYDVQDLGTIWTGSKKDEILTQLLNKLKNETRSEYILKVDSDEVFPHQTMVEVYDLEPTEDFYTFPFRHFENNGMLDPLYHKDLLALRLFRNSSDIHWTGRYGTETLTRGNTKIPVRKGKPMVNPFLHFGNYRKKERRHEYKYGGKEHRLIDIPWEYTQYVPHHS